ncbi:hypothetical protein DL766_010286 [Monosporascus sp. MC13-8B]|uniref:Mid2 domain-containing protein n=1 Tax=Monosporascus cannonballus TaxID=155416 RepID=A0ABY0GRX1_9PEZI|nr:hypothetical protein DL762_009962 [Monosporascus cannonballus]RYO76679.1 hypothetical protein DL763_010258 [Monosporascus cannonballus]RYP01881.1 hypothetical protein DL766_010286 [Monosporascus sp. MC13-8B]
MLPIRLASTVGYALGLWAVVSSASTADPTIHKRNAPGFSSADTLQVVGRALSDFKNQKRQTQLQDSASLEKSWSNAVLFSLDAGVEKGDAAAEISIEVTCVTCYLKGDQVGEQVENITDTTFEWVKNSTGELFDNVLDGLDSSDFDVPPLELDFNIPYPDIPECSLRFQFDGLELYLVLNTVLSGNADYKLPLYTSNTLAGLSLNSDTFVGVIFSVDLILSTSADVDFTSGIHIKVDDGAAIELSLFGNNISRITYNGGQLEFLPVTVLHAGGNLRAALRLGTSAGIAIESKAFVGFPAPVSAGLEVGVYADIVEFATEFTSGTNLEGGDECALQMQQSYQFGLGAAAGASVAIADLTWGPTPETQTPIFFTTVTNCATQGTPTTVIEATASLMARADEELETTTLTEEVTYTGMICQSPGRVYCPVSLQETTKVVSTKTLVTAMPSGSSAAFPTLTDSVVANVVPFGTNIKSVLATTGIPTSYVPQETNEPSEPEDSGEAGQSRQGEVRGIDTRIIIGASVGGGVLLIAAIVAGWMYAKFPSSFNAFPGIVAMMDMIMGANETGGSLCLKRRKYAAVPSDGAVFVRSSQSYSAGGVRPPKRKVEWSKASKADKTTGIMTKK